MATDNKKHATIEGDEGTPKKTRTSVKLSFKPNTSLLRESKESVKSKAPHEDKIKKKNPSEGEKEILVVNYDYSSSSSSIGERSSPLAKSDIVDVNAFFKSIFPVDDVNRMSLLLKKPIDVSIKSLTISFLFLPSGESIVSKMHKSAKLLKTLTKSKGYILYLHDPSTNELFIASSKWQELQKTRYGWKIEQSKTIASYVARNKRGTIVDMQLINLDYYNGLDIPNLYSSNVLSVPIMSFNDRFLGVLDLFRVSGIPYTKYDLDYVQYYLKWCGQSLYQNEECVLYEKYREVVSKIMSDLTLGFGYKHDREEENESVQALYHILLQLQQILNAESATVFLETNGALYREVSTDLLKDTLNPELRARKELHIAKMTVNSLHPTQSYKDVYNDLRFDKEIDFKCERIIRSVLSSRFIRENRLIGVLQVVNKITEDAFGPIDEQFMKYIIPYIAIWSQLESQNVLVRLQGIRNTVFIDVLKNQLNFEIDPKKLFDYENIQDVDIPQDFEKISFQPSSESIQYELPLFVFYMIKNVCIKKDHVLKPLYNYVQMVERCYSDAPLHNFEFAFYSLHAVYCLIKAHPDYFDGIETFCIMMACLSAHISFKDEFKCSQKHCITPFLAEYRRDSKVPQNDWIVQFLLKSSGVLKAYRPVEENCLSCMIKELMTVNSLHVADDNLKKLDLLKNNKMLDAKNNEHRRLIRLITVAAANFSIFNSSHSLTRKKFETQFYNYYELEARDLAESHQKAIFQAFLKTIVSPLDKVMKYIFPKYDLVSFP